MTSFTRIFIYCVVLSIPFLQSCTEKEDHRTKSRKKVLQSPVFQPSNSVGNIGQQQQIIDIEQESNSVLNRAGIKADYDVTVRSEDDTREAVARTKDENEEDVTAETKEEKNEEVEVETKEEKKEEVEVETKEEKQEESHPENSAFGVKFSCDSQSSFGWRVPWVLDRSKGQSSDPFSMELNGLDFFRVTPLRFVGEKIAVKIYDQDSSLVKTIADDSSMQQIYKTIVTGKEISLDLNDLSDGRYSMIFCDPERGIDSCASNFSTVDHFGTTSIPVHQISSNGKISDYEKLMKHTIENYKAPFNPPMGSVYDFRIKNGKAVENVMGFIHADVNERMVFDPNHWRNGYVSKIRELAARYYPGLEWATKGSGVYAKPMAPFSSCNRSVSPLIVDLYGKGIRMTAPERVNSSDPRMFRWETQKDPNLKAYGFSWIENTDEAGFLVLDIDQDGYITSPKELFGNLSQLPDNTQVANGFLALKKYDNHLSDGGRDRIDSRDQIYTRMKIWFDLNKDRISQPSELIPLADAGIASISLQYLLGLEIDQHGNESRQRSTVTLSDGSFQKVVDVWFMLDVGRGGHLSQYMP